MMPVVAFNLLHEIGILTTSIRVFIDFCVKGLAANPERCQYYAENSTSVVTVLNPHIGYLKAAEIAKEYLKSGKSIRQIVLEKGLLTSEQLDKVFDLRAMTDPGIHK
jgi:aspartate ammonia-lyase